MACFAAGRRGERCGEWTETHYQTDRPEIEP